MLNTSGIKRARTLLWINFQFLSHQKINKKLFLCFCDEFFAFSVNKKNWHAKKITKIMTKLAIFLLSVYRIAKNNKNQLSILVILLFFPLSIANRIPNSNFSALFELIDSVSRANLMNQDWVERKFHEKLIFRHLGTFLIRKVMKLN